MSALGTGNPPQYVPDTIMDYQDHVLANTESSKVSKPQS